MEARVHTSGIPRLAVKYFQNRVVFLLLLILLITAFSLFQKESTANSGYTPSHRNMPEPVLQNGHTGVISCLTFSPDGRIFATGSIDNTLKLWDAVSGKLLATLTGHSQSVKSLCFSPDGSILASGSEDGMARIWDVSRGKCRYTLEGSGSAIALSHDGRMLASGGDDGLVRIWDTSTGKPVRVLGEPSSYPVVTLAFSSDGRILAAGGNDSMARLWDVAAGKLLATLSGHRNWILNLAVSSDGKTLATASHDKTAMLWEIPSGKLLATLEEHRDSVNLVAYSPSGRILATASRDGSVKLWDVPSGKPVATLEGNSDTIWSVAFSPDGHSIAMGSHDGTVKLWDVPSGALRKTLKNPGGFITSIAFSPDGKTLAAGGLESAARLWDISSGKEVSVFREAQSRGIVSIAFSPGGSLLATGGHDGSAKFWDLASGRLQSASLKDASSLKNIIFAPDGKTLITLSYDGGAKQLDAATGKVRSTLNRQGDTITRVAFSPDGHTIATGSQSGSVVFLDSDTTRPRTTLNGHKGSITTLSFSPDGSLLASGSQDDTACIWDTGKGSLCAILQGSSGNMQAVAFSHEGKWLATGGYDNTVQIWEPRTGKLHAVLKAKSAIVQSGGYNPLIFSPDGHTLAAGGIDNTVHLWNVNTGTLISHLGGHSREIGCIVFSPDGHMVFTGSDDGTIKIWDAATGRLVSSLTAHSAVVRDLAFSPDGRILISASEDTTLKLWDAATGELLLTALDFNTGRDWLVVSPEGFFDGTTGGWQKILWRMGDNIFDTAEPEQYFSEFYQPGLLKDVFMGGKPIPDVLRERGDPRASMTIAEKDRRLPMVSIEAPRESSSRMAMVKIHVEEAPADGEHLTGSCVKDVRLFRNGTLVKKWEGEQTSGSLLSYKIPVIKGINSISAYAFNRDNVKSRDAHVIVRGADSLKRKPRAFILSIGINRYSMERFNLEYAVKDAENLAAMLKKNLPYPADSIITLLLLDERATREGILSALRDLVKKIEPEDSVIITYAGHGTIFDKTFYFIPHDIGHQDSASLKDLCSKGISDKELERILVGDRGMGGLQAQHIALIIDACHSGQVLDSDEWRVGPMNSRGLAQLAWEKGMEILTASQSDQFAKELKSIGHGLLTYALLEGFSEAPRNGGRLLGSVWLDFAAFQVPQLSESPKLRGIVPAFMESCIALTDSTIETLKGQVNTDKLTSLKGKEYLEEELTTVLKKAGFTTNEVQKVVKTAKLSPEKHRMNAQTPKVFHRREDPGAKEWVVSGEPGEE